MHKSKAGKLLVFLMVLGLCFGLMAGCTPEEDEVKGEVELLYVIGWDCALASTTVVATVLEDMGYDVTVMSLDAAPMWEGIASGDGDAMTTAWLPHTHEAYLEAREGKVVEVAVNYTDPAAIGLVVPTYVEIDSIEEINDYLEEFDNRIVGIDPGAGLMRSTENAIEVYDLDVELVAGSGVTMTAALKDAIDRGDWVIATGWSPHWKFAEWDLKYLEDPELVFGGEEYIATYARLGLDEDMPEVYEFLQNFQWGAADIGAVMAMNAEEGADPTESARTWVDNNQDKVQQWIP